MPGCKLWFSRSRPRRERHFRKLRSPSSVSIPGRLSGSFFKPFGETFGHHFRALGLPCTVFRACLHAFPLGLQGRLFAVHGHAQECFVCVFAKWRYHCDKTAISAVLGSSSGCPHRPWGDLWHTSAFFLHSLGFHFGPCGDLWQAFGDGYYGFVCIMCFGAPALGGIFIFNVLGLFLACFLVQRFGGHLGTSSVLWGFLFLESGCPCTPLGSLDVFGLPLGSPSHFWRSLGLPLAAFGASGPICLCNSCVFLCLCVCFFVCLSVSVLCRVSLPPCFSPACLFLSGPVS